MHAAVKRKSSVTDGPEHLLQELRDIAQSCTGDERAIVFPVIENNGFFGHPENVLVGLLGK